MLRFLTGDLAQYLDVAASFIVTQFIFTASKKTSEHADAAGDVAWQLQ